MSIPVYPEASVALKGKKGLGRRNRNDQSIAWGCAKALRALGADLAVTYLNERAKKHVEPLAKMLEAPTVRYIAAEVGPKGIRVHAISPGPLATRAASGIPEFDELMDKAQSKAPARSLVSIDDVGRATAFLALDGAKLITGGVTYIDGGYHIID
jgi:enoyl-[acyl-carrier-protein] reductase (NADH)